MKSSKQLIGLTIGRPQSPKVELLMQELIHDAIQALMEETHFYRHHRIDISQILAQADSNWTSAALSREFQHRPWIPWSRNRGFTHNERQLLQQDGGVDALGMLPEKMGLTFIIPNAKTWCFKCERIAVHDSIPHIHFSPYILNSEAIGEPLGTQNFLFNMRCQECKSPPTTFMVRRVLLSVQLCGRSHLFLPQRPHKLPTAGREVLKDATGAAAPGDVFGAFYHLRTLMEHQMKAELGIAISEEVAAHDLCARYDRAIDPILSRSSSLKSAFEACCVNMQGRTGSIMDYEKVLDAVCGHFGLKLKLQKPEVN